MNTSPKIVLTVGLLAAWLVQTGAAGEVAPPPGTKVDPATKAVTASRRGFRNVAQGRPYTLNPRPNYRYCTDPGDKTQLTDGKHVSGYFWVQRGTVGWQHAGTALITIDLGTVEPIRGLSFHTAAGTAGVGWPQQLSIFVSEDGKRYHSIGDLVELSAPRGLPKPIGYRQFTYWTDQLETKGRYVQIAVVLGGAYVFCDEIEVWGGDEAWLSRPIGGKVVGDVAAYLRQAAATSCVRRRMRMDAAAVRKATNNATLSKRKRAAALREVDRLESEISSFTAIDPKTLRAVIPLNALHARILARHAEVLQSRGPHYGGFVIWENNRWDPLGYLDAPSVRPSQRLTLSVRMMRGEYRAVAFNITNAGRAAASGWIGIRGLPSESASKGDIPSYVMVQSVEHVDTKEGVAVADALTPAKRQDEWRVIHLPAGITRQVWVTFHPTKLPAGTYQGKIYLNGGPADWKPDTPKYWAAWGEAATVTLRVEDIEFPKQPALSLGMWDYTDEPYAYDITKTNQPLAIADMRAHFVDSPWAHSTVIGRPEKKHLDADGNLKPGTIDFARFDRWLNDWKGARRYLVFLSVGTSLAGHKMGTPRFDRLVGQWFTAWEAHCKKRGLKPKQVGVLLVDEPHADEQHRRILAWARAIKAATGFFCIWEDPTDRTLSTPDQVAMLEACDAICPNLGIYKRLGKRAEDFYARFVGGGKRELWFYQCSGPARQLDPYAYHRLQAWHCWVHGAVGMGFWAYGDAGGGSSWCEYLSQRTSYSPAYIAPDSITTSKHWEAVREGIEDYEYLRMLKQRVEQLTKAGKSSAALRKAKQLLIDGPKRVARYEPVSWFAERDRSVADAVRLEILDALLALSRN